jgi:hypothetical protein
MEHVDGTLLGLEMIENGPKPYYKMTTILCGG